MVETLNNFAYSTIANTPGSAGTTITLQTGDGAKFPSVYPFRVTAWPIGALPLTGTAEIILVNNKAGDSLTSCTRQYESTNAQNLGTTYQVAQLVTSGVIAEIIAASDPAGSAATAQAAAEAYAATLCAAIYPVGAIYYADGVHLTANPNTFLPGLSGSTWELLSTSAGAATALFCYKSGDPIFGTAGATGGSAQALIAHTHSTTTEIGAHYHTASSGSHTHGSGSMSATNGNAQVSDSGHEHGPLVFGTNYLMGGASSGSLSYPSGGTIIEGVGATGSGNASVSDSGHTHPVGGTTDGGTGVTTGGEVGTHVHNTNSQSVTTSNSLPPYVVGYIWLRTA